MIFSGLASLVVEDDYLVGAAVACITGSFDGRLGAIGQSTSNGELTAEGTGSLVVDQGVIQAKVIHVAYTLALGDHVDEAKAHRAHDTHTRYCPVARSIGGCIELTLRLKVSDNSFDIVWAGCAVTPVDEQTVTAPSGALRLRLTWSRIAGLQ
ncbi:OsmC family protein [Streptomyces sp. NPDC056296]|uniref:OsmC family protein n=1 Tax=Streptomyces sp. NPDC056296 TaxID=3345775 RepID=UPI0035E138CB